MEVELLQSNQKFVKGECKEKGCCWHKTGSSTSINYEVKCCDCGKTENRSRYGSDPDASYRLSLDPYSLSPRYGQD
jgi:hypothetical protein